MQSSNMSFVVGDLIIRREGFMTVLWEGVGGKDYAAGPNEGGGGCAGGKDMRHFFFNL